VFIAAGQLHLQAQAWQEGDVHIGRDVGLEHNIAAAINRVGVFTLEAGRPLALWLHLDPAGSDDLADLVGNRQVRLDKQVMHRLKQVEQALLRSETVHQRSSLRLFVAFRQISAIQAQT
jgi:hypothetical protein